MFLIDGPYVSEYLKRTLVSAQIPVIKTQAATQYLSGHEINFIDEVAACEFLKTNTEAVIYTNSENALDWIYRNLPKSELTETIKKVKDKVAFRESLNSHHPDYYFKGFTLSELHEVDPTVLPFPVILKPSIGFFSLGVQSIEDSDHWNASLSAFDKTLKTSEGLYPKGVLDNSSFIVEEILRGDEFAIDCYFDEQGQVIVLNIMKHLFASESDVNDRVYFTSGNLMNEYLKPIQDYLSLLGNVFKFKNFPAHIEIRINESGEIAPIEINPLRFGGWCSTPDLAQYAWDMNIYECLVNKTWPDWPKKTQLNPGKVFALVVLNNSTGVEGLKIKSFDYEALLQQVRNPLELRRTNFKAYPVFGFLMCSVPEDDFSELTDLLHSDLCEFIKL